MNTSTIDLTPFLRRPLRPWQDEAARLIIKSVTQGLQVPDRRDIPAFILHAFPGTGKTLVQLLCAKYMIYHGIIDAVVICVPSKILKNQMENDAADVGLHLNNKNLRIWGPFEGLVVSYQQLGAVSKETKTMPNAQILRDMCKDKRVLVCADEAHHIGDRRNWGTGFKEAFDEFAAGRLITSGTPFRSDGESIPWVRYFRNKMDLSMPNAYSYGYGRTANYDKSALEDEVVRDISIMPMHGQARFTIKKIDRATGAVIDETEYDLSITDNIDELYPDEFDGDKKILDRAQFRKELKSARRLACIECGTPAHPYGTDYVKEVLTLANDRLTMIRANGHSYAGGLIVCHSIPHANAVAEALRHWTGEDSVVIHSETGEGTSSARSIKNFRDNRTPARARWIVAVGQVSEGVDIPHLRLCVYLTNIQAPLSWTQIVGRILRVEPGIAYDLQTAYLYQYDDGIENITDGDVTTAQSVGIKLYAETLLYEREVTIREREARKKAARPEVHYDDFNFGSSTEVESHNADGSNSQFIYRDERMENDELTHAVKVLAAELGMALEKALSLLKRAKRDHWEKAVEDLAA